MKTIKLKYIAVAALGSFLNFSVASASDLPGIAQDTTVQHHSGSKVKNTSKKVAHGTKHGAKKVGKGAKTVGKKVGSATKNTAQKVDRKIDKDKSVD